jgi:tetratricopeptide (TPR) repeat protein
MGEVYAAYDPELDRKVAVKLLRVKPGNGVSLVEGRQRTLREAQAIARLSHPNVVVVYDVGTFGDQVFIAMEFVEGNTVTYWVQSQARSWQEVLKVFMAAGRGLAAAHDKGLVHRDFKPDNVMVGRTQVRVMDFGLARQLHDKEPGSPRRSSDPQVAARPDGVPIAQDGEQSTMVLNTVAGESSGPIEVPTHADMLEASLTRTGAMMGTPAYMAPEQFLGVGTDARTDQFSFCVALYEALYGQRPFGGNTLYALTNNVVQGRIREVPAHARVPAWLRKVVLRGLRSNPAERYPSMAELIETLGKNPTVQRRRVIMVVASVAVLIGFGIGVKRSAAQQTAMCSAGPAKLMDVWEVVPNSEGRLPRQEAINAAFLRSGKSYAADVFATVRRSLDRYVGTWATAYKEACEATQVRREQSGEVLDLRMSCLNERLGALRSLTELLLRATGDVVENAVSASNSLGSLDRCSDVALLRAVVRPPDDPTIRAEVSNVRRRLADLKALLDSGRFAETLKNGPSLIREARALNYEPLVAEALATMGSASMRSNQPRDAEKSLVESFLIADASRHDEIRAEVAENLVFVVGYQSNRVDEAKIWAKAAEAVLQRLGGHDLLRGWLLNDLGAVHIAEGDTVAAVKVMKEALRLKEAALGTDHPDVGATEGNLAVALGTMAQYQEARVHMERSVTLIERGLGAQHPDLATQLSNYGEILNALGLYAQARQAFERAQSIWEREFGRADGNIPDALTGIGISYIGEGRPTSALPVLEHALKMRAEGADRTKRAETELALAQALYQVRRDVPRARTLAEEAKTIFKVARAEHRHAAAAEWIEANFPN